MAIFQAFLYYSKFAQNRINYAREIELLLRAVQMAFYI